MTQLVVISEDTVASMGPKAVAVALALVLVSACGENFSEGSLPFTSVEGFTLTRAEQAALIEGPTFVAQDPAAGTARIAFSGSLEEANDPHGDIHISQEGRTLVVRKAPPSGEPQLSIAMTVVLDVWGLQGGQPMTDLEIRSEGPGPPSTEAWQTSAPLTVPADGERPR